MLNRIADAKSEFDQLYKFYACYEAVGAGREILATFQERIDHLTQLELEFERQEGVTEEMKFFKEFHLFKQNHAKNVASWCQIL